MCSAAGVFSARCMLLSSRRCLAHAAVPQARRAERVPIHEQLPDVSVAAILEQAGCTMLVTDAQGLARLATRLLEGLRCITHLVVWGVPAAVHLEARCCIVPCRLALLSSTQQDVPHHAGIWCHLTALADLKQKQFAAHCYVHDSAHRPTPPQVVSTHADCLCMEVQILQKQGLTVKSFNDLEALGRSQPCAPAHIEPQDLCNVHYSSGTAGNRQVSLMASTCRDGDACFGSAAAMRCLISAAVTERPMRRAAC